MWRLLLLVIGVATASAVIGSAASLQVDGGTIQVFTYTVTVPTLTATPTGTAAATPTPGLPLAAAVDVKPESLQKKSEGEPVRAMIELPRGYDVAQIEIDSVRLCRGALCGATGLAATGGKVEGRRLSLSFERARVVELVADVQPPATIAFTVAGTTKDGAASRAFSGSDTVKIVDPSPGLTPSATSIATATPTPSATAMAAATVTGTPTPGRISGDQPSPTPTASPTGTPTPAAPTAVPTSPTASPTATTSPSPTSASAPAEAASSSPTPTATATRTPTTLPAPGLSPTATGGS